MAWSGHFVMCDPSAYGYMRTETQCCIISWGQGSQGTSHTSETISGTWATWQSSEFHGATLPQLRLLVSPVDEAVLGGRGK
jgi:hypothetical protein